jgi:hypothetical protein
LNVCFLFFFGLSILLKCNDRFEEVFRGIAETPPSKCASWVSFAEHLFFDIEFHVCSESGSNPSGPDIEATALNSNLVPQ